MTGLKLQKNKFIHRLTALIITVSLFSYMLYDTLPAFAAEQREIIVAVIDTGVNTEHAFLKENIWFNGGEIPGNGLDDDNNGYIDDVNGWDFYNDDNTVFHDVVCGDDRNALERRYEDDHGTSVAGAILEGAKKVCDEKTYKIKIMSLKIGTSDGADRDIDAEKAVKAIEYAKNNGASICNLSWGGTGEYPALEKAVGDSEMLFVCAAGNEGKNNDLIPVYPAGYGFSNVLSVTNANVGEKTDLIGNYGKDTVDVCTHGIDVWTSLSHGMGFVNGSSMSAAEVSGYAAALMASAGLSAEEVAGAIVGTSDVVPGITGELLRGGLCNPERLAKSVEKQETPETGDFSAALLLNYNEITVGCGEGFILKALPLPAGSATGVTFESEESFIATVSYNGVVIGKNEGDVSITVKTENGTEGICLVHVNGN